jgi:hypothetical protein
MSGGRLPGKRPVWTHQDLFATLGPYSVRLSFPGTKYPWAVYKNGVPLRRAMVEDNARRWAEEQQARK